MKTAAKVFLIFAMITEFILIFPIIVSAIALKKLKTANSVKELQAIAIVCIVTGQVVAGVLMLCMKDKDLLEGREQNNAQQNQAEATKVEDED